MLLNVINVVADDRFNRKIIKLQDPAKYKYFKLDDIEFPYLESDKYTVSCLTYKGTQRYYVEVTITNNNKYDLQIPLDFISFNKPGYTVIRTNAIDAAISVAADAGEKFIPSPTPNPTSTQTTVNATATTVGNQTQINGTSTTTTNQSGAQLGNAIGNIFAARSFYKAQSIEKKFANFLGTFAQENNNPLLKSGESRIIVATFEQLKNKKAPFDIVIKIDSQEFIFKYKE